ncbi:MAG TPA: hypothetical protein VN932_13185 [Rhizomicrobium sp.]|nr:hypothetical protein [Rhizomicrobium sp.]
MKHSSLSLYRTQAPFEFGSRQAYANSNDRRWAREADSHAGNRANAPGRVLLEIALVLAAASALALTVTLLVPAL